MRLFISGIAGFLGGHRADRMIEPGHDAIYVPERPQEVKYATCSADKARRILGYRTTISLREGLVELVEFIRKGGPKRFRDHLDLEIINQLTPKTWSDRQF